MSSETEHKPSRIRRGIRKADLLKLALGSLGANKLRTGLTILGVSIGVFSVVGVMTALSAMRVSIDSGLSFLGANVFEVQRRPSIQFGGHDAAWRKRPTIKPRQAMEFKEMMEEEGIIVSLIAYDGGERVTYRDKKTSPRITIVGTNENYLSTNKFNLNYGRNLTGADIEFNRPVVVIGREVEKELFPHEDPIGKMVVVRSGRYEVVGVLEERGSIFGQSMDNFVIVPVTRFVAQNWNRHRSMQLSVQSPSAEEMENTQDLAIGKMRLIRGLEPEDPNNFEISSNDSLQEAFGRIATVVGTGGLIISAIALLCSGIGIMNIMLVSVTERTREIGVRKSLGAKRFDIMSQFLIESVVLSEIGATLGIILGIIVGNLVAVQMNVSMIIPWNWILIAVVVCSAIGIGFGLYPAWRAARLNPVDALRYE